MSYEINPNSAGQPWDVTTVWPWMSQPHCPCCVNYNRCPTCGKPGYQPQRNVWWYDPGPTCGSATQTNTDIALLS